jgi:hypothetical protein
MPYVQKSRTPITHDALIGLGFTFHASSKGWYKCEKRPYDAFTLAEATKGKYALTNISLNDDDTDYVIREVCYFSFIDQIVNFYYVMFQIKLI